MSHLPSNHTFPDSQVAQYIAVTMIGGAVSEAAGGDFLEGAVAAAMVHLFNDKALQDALAKYQKIIEYGKINIQENIETAKTLSINGFIDKVKTKRTGTISINYEAVLVTVYILWIYYKNLVISISE